MEDKAANYVLGLIFIFPWVISISLNPLLIRYFRQTQTKTSVLFKCLALTDLLINLWCPLVYTFFMWSPVLLPSSHIVLRYTRVWICMTGCFAQIIGFLIAVYRAFMIVSPCCNLKQRYALIYLGGYFAYMAVDTATLFVTREYFKGDEL